MKSRLKRQVRWSLSIVTILAGLNLGLQTRAEPLQPSDPISSLETTTNSLAQNNISAYKLFRNAYENRYTWDSQFLGYTAVVEVKQDNEAYRGQIRINPDLGLEISGIDKKDIRQTVENQMRMLIVHRQQVPFEVVHKNSTFTFGTTDKTGAVEIIQKGDKSNANYKILNQQVVQVKRILGPHSFTVDTLDTQISPEGYMATRYRTTARQPQTNQFLAEEVSNDTYKKIGRYYLPARQVVQHTERGEQSKVELNFTDIQLLPGKN